jgi:hypothetical protein
MTEDIPLAQCVESPMMVLLILTACATGLLAGASLDQSLKQLPARHVIGTRSFSEYSRAADLRSGVAFYGILGGAVLLLNLASALVVSQVGIDQTGATAAYVGAFLAILHSLVTAIAAPVNFSQRGTHDEADLSRIFDRFARLQAIRCVLQLANFAATLCALALA